MNRGIEDGMGCAGLVPSRADKVESLENDIEKLKQQINDSTALTIAAWEKVSGFGGRDMTFSELSDYVNETAFEEIARLKGGAK